MRVSVPFDIDIRGYLHLLEEQGADVAGWKARWEELDKSVPPEKRLSDRRWNRLAADVYRAARQWSTPEPSTLEEIRRVRPANRRDILNGIPQGAALVDRVAGGWYGRIAGCILGKPVECLMKHHDSRRQLYKLFSEAGEYPLRDFISERVMVPYWKAEGTLPSWFESGRGNASLREYLREAPADDDLNYTVLSLELLKQKGPSFGPDDVLDLWLRKLHYGEVCTAEKVAYRNRVMGLSYPQTASFLNPYCEWIGAQIRADLYGYVNPGRPEEAARMAWNDAAASHLKNGIYGAMWVASAIATAFVESDPEAIIQGGLEQIPSDCRFAEHVRATVETAKANGDDFDKTLDSIWERLGYYHCVHAVNNACVVAAALMHGGADFGKVIGIAVMGGWDTDCNGATAGSIAGVMLGAARIESRWKEPFNDTLHTAVEGRRVQRISDLVAETLEWIGRLGYPT